MSLHKLTYQALRRILIAQMLAFCQTQYCDLHHDLIKLSMGESFLPLMTLSESTEKRSRVD